MQADKGVLQGVLPCYADRSSEPPTENHATAKLASAGLALDGQKRTR
jgi:hypothetical protein